ncbi:MAG: tetratricopeptide repeat protein, partial [Burkholderiaceae bacterium]|nr:tetratricopeptide repeat protein [Burkholderiaceae bacterium]
MYSLDPDAALNLLALLQAGKLAECEAAARDVTARFPQFASGWKFLGVALQRQGRLAQAFPALLRAAQMLPEDDEAQGNLGLALLEADELALGERFLRRALELAPDNAMAWNNLAHGLARQGRLIEAEDLQRHTLELEPAHREFIHNLGSILHDQGRIAEAEACYRQALALDPLFPHAHWYLGMCRLQQADFAAGWREYEWRWQTPRLMGERSRYGGPRWTGEQDIADKTVLLWAEQGLGDTLQFCRYVREVAARGARAVLDVPATFVRLLAPLAPVNDQAGTVPAHDFHCPLMSLPPALGQDGIAPCAPYLHADAALTALWRERLGPQRKPRVGIAWSGNRRHIQDYRRSIPVEHFMTLASPACEFVCLQAALSESERALLDALACPHFENLLTDYAETAALIANLDLVLCVDTSVAHLAAAMGKPVWLLLSYQADWRWLSGRDDSPWYPTLKIFRQPRLGDWQAVFAAV